MQQEKNGTPALLQPKKEIIDYSYEPMVFKPSQDSESKEDLIQVKKEIIEQLLDQAKNELNLTSKQSEEDISNVNGQVIDEIGVPKKECEKGISSKPDETITGEIPNVEGQTVLNNKSVPIVAGETSKNQLNKNKNSLGQGEKNQINQDKEIYSNSGAQPKNEITNTSDKFEEDSSGESDLEYIENNPDLVVIDIADYDSESPTPDHTNPAEENVKKPTPKVNATRTDQPHWAKKKLTDNDKRRFLKSLEQQLMYSDRNPSTLPTQIWKSLKNLGAGKRKQFIRSMKDYKVTNPTPGHGKNALKKELLIKNEGLAYNLPYWLEVQWAAMEYDPKWKNPFNASKPVSESRKLKFKESFERMLEQNKGDFQKLPKHVWMSMKQLLPQPERKHFMKSMKEKIARMDSGDLWDTSSYISPPKRNFNSDPHSQTSRYKKKEEPKPLYSFDRDFQEELKEKDVGVIATTSKASPNIFAQYEYPQPSSSERNTYTELSYHGFKDNFQTPKWEDTSRRSSFSYDNQKLMDETSYSGQNNSMYYSDGAAEDRRWTNFQSDASMSTQNDLYNSEMQTEFSQRENLNQAPYSRGLKRKYLDNTSSYDHSHAKRSNKPNESIEAVITDDNSLSSLINDQQASLLTAELINLKDNVSFYNQRHIPRFYLSGLSNGVFRINCADQESFDWLSRMVSQFPPLWPGAKLRVGNFVKFFSKQVRVYGFIAGGRTEDSITMLSRLERQNPGLNTGAWKVVKQYAKVKGQVILFQIDKPSLEALKNMKYKAFLGLSCITFTKDNPKGKKRKH